jgi:hypothetical protein
MSNGQRLAAAVVAVMFRPSARQRPAGRSLVPADGRNQRGLSGWNFIWLEEEAGLEVEPAKPPRYVEPEVEAVAEGLFFTDELAQIF